MKKSLVTIILLLVTVPFIFAKDLSGELKIAGGTAHLKFMKTIAKNMMRKNPNLKISIEGGGSGVGIKKVGENLVDIGNSGRDLKEDEIKKYGLIPYKIAIDGIAVIVNRNNTIKDLTFEQMARIFSGEISNWKQLGGEDAKINIYTRDAESGTRKTFVKLGLKKGKIASDGIIVNSNGNMKTLVSGDKYGIGYISIGYLDDSVKGLSIEGINPNTDNVKNGSYEIRRFLYSVTKGEPKGLAKSFIDNLLNEDGQKIIKKYGFIPVK